MPSEGVRDTASDSSHFDQSVADFLAANRCAGRYLLCIADGIAGGGGGGAGAFQAYLEAKEERQA